MGLGDQEGRHWGRCFLFLEERPDSGDMEAFPLADCPDVCLWSPSLTFDQGMVAGLFLPTVTQLRRDLVQSFDQIRANTYLPAP